MTLRKQLSRPISLRPLAPSGHPLTSQRVSPHRDGVRPGQGPGGRPRAHGGRARLGPGPARRRLAQTRQASVGRHGRAAVAGGKEAAALHQAAAAPQQEAALH